MRGLRLTGILAIPFVSAALYIAYQIFFLEQEGYFYYLIPVLVILLALYFASAEINYWFYKKFPPKLDPPVKVWLNEFFPFYENLIGDDKTKFETRLYLYLEARAFKLVLKDQKDIPYDFKASIAAHAIQMTMGHEDYLIGNYDRIFCYNHPFPSPAIKKLHGVEVHHEDGVILLSIEQLMQALGARETIYNIAFHAYAEVLTEMHPELRLKDSKWKPDLLLEKLKFDLDHINQMTGMELTDPSFVSLTLFFTFPEKYKELYPEQFVNYCDLLNYEY